MSAAIKLINVKDGKNQLLYVRGTQFSSIDSHIANL